MNPPLLSRASLISTILFFLTALAKAGQGYDLSHVDGIESFAGSARAQDLLATNGFVVAAPEFRQIFEPYIESPLPVLITADSAWHTYHFLLEHGIKEMESSQSARLASFSRLLFMAANAQASNGVPEFTELANYAALGLALQDAPFATKLKEDQKQILAGLISGEAPVRTPIGLELSPVNFRPQSFYTQSPELAAYYRARQWYATVDFRLSDERETRLALCLSWLVHSRPDLMNLWTELSTPYEAFVAPAEDATISDYFEEAKRSLGADFTLSALQQRANDIIRKLRAKPKLPRINDQLLDPAAYARFPQITAGFRLFPARQLPCAICFQNTVDPKVKHRLCPSGLDFFTASSSLRSPAALRAARTQFGEMVLSDILKADPGAMPNSLYGQSMLLLSGLQKSLPPQVPPPFRIEAWADLKLWTQLGAWAEQRHTWALHAKPAVMFSGLAEPPPGVVEPYPDFFAGLAKLCRDTSSALHHSQPAEPFDPKKAAAGVLEAKSTAQKIRDLSDEQDGQAEKLRQYSAFMESLWAKGQRDVSDEMLKRMAESGPTNQAETEMLRRFYDARLSVPHLLTNFAAVCDRLAVLAGKELVGQPATKEEATWITSYGITLAGFHFYSGNSWLVPVDDFSILSRIFNVPVKSTVLYAAVSRPQALYVILPYKDRMQLYRGAVLNYREFERPEGRDLSDASWQTEVRENKAPSAPPFTVSFLQTDPPDAEQTNRLTSLSFAAQDLAKPPVSPLVSLEIKQTLLAAIPSVARGRMDGERMMSSDDERHVILVEMKDGKQRLVRDGVAEKSHDSVQLESFSPDSQHVVYVGGDDGKYCVVKDGVEGTRYAQIGPLRQDSAFVFSSNCVHLAYEATLTSGKKCVVVDEVEGAPYDEILDDSFSFSRDSSHYVYAAKRGTQGFVVKDNQVVVECDADGWNSVRQGPYISPDGERVACLIKRGSQWFANVGGKDSHPWKSIVNAWQTSLSSDGHYFSYAAQDDRGFLIVLDDQEFRTYGITPAAFSPNGKSWAVVNEDESGSWVVMNGTPGKKYQGTILSPSFSPDGRRLGYLVESHRGTGPLAVIHGEQEFENTMPELFNGIRFSPDSAHYSISGKRGQKPVVIIDGKQYPAADFGEGGTEVVFSPNSERWAYLAFHGGRINWIVSGVEYGPYGKVLRHPADPDEPWLNYEEANLYFSPNSRHFTFRATRDGRHLLVVDGVEREFKTAWSPHSAIVFDSPNQFHFLVRNEREIDYVDVTIQAH